MPTVRLFHLPPVVLALAAVALALKPAGATTIVVPDNYPTIQAAIDAAQGDRIFVRDGMYAENLMMRGGVSVEPLPVQFDGELNPTTQSYPRVMGTVRMPGGTLRGFHVIGRILVDRSPSYDDVQISECRVDSGIARVGQPLLLGIRGCIVHGGIDVWCWYGEITNCTVLGGGISLFVEGGGLAIRGNQVEGPATVGLHATTWGGGGEISGNTVTGCDMGMYLANYSGGPVKDNVVADCKGTGIRVQSGGPNPHTISNNLVQNCGGHGFELHHAAGSLTGNTVLDVGGCGIWADNWETFEAGPMTLQSNRILRSGSDGIHYDYAGQVAGNVVGRSGARGIVVLPTGTSIDVHGNTSYWNSLAGFDLNSDAGGAIANNVVYSNQREGLVWSGNGSPTLSCNDWYANVGAATSGVAPGATDLAVDPYFCNVPADDVHLAVFSPLRNTPSCGLIGALDVGCSEPTAVSSPPQVIAPAFACSPRPTSGGVRFTWRRLGEAGKVEVFDATGARRWKGDAGKGTEGADWDAKDGAGNPLPAGVYFARIRAGSLQATTRVVVVR